MRCRLDLDPEAKSEFGLEGMCKEFDMPTALRTTVPSTIYCTTLAPVLGVRPKAKSALFMCVTYARGLKVLVLGSRIKASRAFEHCAGLDPGLRFLASYS